MNESSKTSESERLCDEATAGRIPRDMLLKTEDVEAVRRRSAKRQSRPKRRELIVPLPNGGTLRCGEGTEYVWGGYLRICDPRGRELYYWDVAEWEESGESVIGAVFGAALHGGKP
jgi:hypothetical protein